MSSQTSRPQQSPSCLLHLARLPKLSEPSQASRWFSSFIRPPTPRPFPSHLLSSGRRSSQSPSSTPARSGPIPGCDIASSLKRGVPAASPLWAPGAPPGTEKGPRADRLTAMHYTRMTAAAVNAASAVVSIPATPTSCSKNYNSQKAPRRPGRSRHAPFYPIRSRAGLRTLTACLWACTRLKRPPTLVSGVPVDADAYTLLSLFILGNRIQRKQR